MNAVEASTVVYAPRAEIYEFLLDFTGYGRYSEYVEGIDRRGDGGPGTEYAITISWWKLRHTVTSAVTAVDPPERIDWRLTDTVAAAGHWRVEEVAGEEPPHDSDAGDATVDGDAANREGPAHRVVLRIEYDPDSVSGESLSLPPLVPLDVVVERVAPHVRAEAEAIVEDVVADLEGRRRAVELTVREDPQEPATETG